MPQIKKVPVVRDVPQIPAGYRLLTIPEAKKHKAALVSTLGQWDIVYLYKGKIDGWGYGNKIMEIDGPGGYIGQAFVIEDSFSSSLGVDGISRMGARVSREEINRLSCVRAQEMAGTTEKLQGSLAVFGRTSAGKSSLLNALFGLNLKVSDGDTTKDVKVVGICGDFQVVDVYGSNDDRLYEEEFSIQGIVRIAVGLICSDTDPSGVRFISNLLKAGKVEKCIYVHTKSGAGYNISEQTKRDEVEFTRKHRLYGPVYTEVFRPETIVSLRNYITQCTGMRFGSRTEPCNKVIISQEYIRNCRRPSW